MQLYMQPDEVISHLKRAVPDFVSTWKNSRESRLFHCQKAMRLDGLFTFCAGLEGSSCSHKQSSPHDEVVSVHSQPWPHTQPEEMLSVPLLLLTKNSVFF